MINNNYRQIGIISSIVFHAILALVFVMLKYELIPENIKPLELIQFGYNQMANNSEMIAPISPISKKNNSYKVGKKSNLVPKKVNLPDANIAAEEELFIPQTTETALNNLDANDEIGNSYDNLKSNVSELLPTENKQISDEVIVPSSDDYLSSLSQKLTETSNANSPYILEGDISSRIILSKIIPSYPAGAQKSVSVKIRLEVNSDGTVGDIIIIKKAGPPFDDSAMQALKKWRFNALSRDVIQTGTITIIYELK